jgi:hypothetical protein
MADVDIAPDADGIVVCSLDCKQLNVHISALRPGWETVEDSPLDNHLDVTKELVAAEAVQLAADEAPEPISIMGLPSPQPDMFARDLDGTTCKARTFLQPTEPYRVKLPYAGSNSCSSQHALAHCSATCVSTTLTRKGISGAVCIEPRCHP